MVDSYYILCGHLVEYWDYICCFRVVRKVPNKEKDMLAIMAICSLSTL